MTPTKHYLLQIPPQEVAHLADGESGGPRLLVQEGVELVRLVLQGLGVGDLHGHPGDDAEAITESLVDNLCVDLERKILIGKKDSLSKDDLVGGDEQLRDRLVLCLAVDEHLRNTTILYWCSKVLTFVSDLRNHMKKNHTRSEKPFEKRAREYDKFSKM